MQYIIYAHIKVNLKFKRQYLITSPNLVLKYSICYYMKCHKDASLLMLMAEVQVFKLTSWSQVSESFG